MESTHLLLESTHYMWKVHICCGKYTFVVESTHLLWKVHVDCGKYTFIVESIHCMWKAHNICGKYTFIVESTHYMSKVVLYYKISFTILFANIYKGKACYSPNLITLFIMNKNIEELKCYVIYYDFILFYTN